MESCNNTLIYTNGFTNRITIQGSSYSATQVPAIHVVAGSLDLAGGDLGINGYSPSPIHFSVTVSNNNKIAKLPAGSAPNSLAAATASITTKDGSVSITFGNGNAKLTTIAKGVVLQNADKAAGSFKLGTNNNIAGSMLLQQ
jgi:hypothetical protein